MINPRLIAVLSGMLFVTACSSGLLGGSDDSGDNGHSNQDPAIKLGDLFGQSSGGGGQAAAHQGSNDNGGLGLTLGDLLGYSAGSGQALVVGDEPFAVRVGASVLSEGGNAADAASAMYLALAVTYPASASLGAGGICVVHDPNSGKNASIDFLVHDPADHGAFGVPGAVAGIARMQHEYGNLPWQRVVSPAQALAAAGFPISQALDARLQAAQNTIRLDADLAHEFLDESGNVKPAGTVVSNQGLASTLNLIREQGDAGFYRGAVAQKIADYSAQQGGGPGTAELGAYRSNEEAAQSIVIGQGDIYLPSADVGAGSFAAKLYPQLLDEDGHPVGNLNSAVKRALANTLSDFGVANVPPDLGSTGFATTDNAGQAVACAVTMNGPFGSGHTVEGTGITLANAPSKADAGIASAFLSPAVATPPDGTVALAGAGAGGPTGTAAMAYALMKLANGDDVTKPSDLRSVATAPYDTVNVITCDNGSCAVLPDPNGHGLGALARQ